MLYEVITIPVWKEDLCVQCGICSFVCPHATIRMKVYEEADLKGAPETFKSCAANRITSYNVCYTKLLRHNSSAPYAEWGWKTPVSNSVEY